MAGFDKLLDFRVEVLRVLCKILLTVLKMVSESEKAKKVAECELPARESLLK